MDYKVCKAFGGRGVNGSLYAGCYDFWGCEGGGGLPCLMGQ